MAYESKSATVCALQCKNAFFFFKGLKQQTTPKYVAQS
jgi:hypothetical protein